jgi:hypothetical protein
LIVFAVSLLIRFLLQHNVEADIGVNVTFYELLFGFLFCWLIWIGCLVACVFSFRRIAPEGIKNRWKRICALAGIVFNSIGLILYSVASISLYSEFPTIKKTNPDPATAKMYAAARQQRKSESEMVDKASEVFQTNFKQHLAEYSESIAVITNPPVLNMDRVESRDDLKLRETKVQNYIEQSKTFETYCDQVPEMFGEELQKLGASEKFQYSSVEKFNKIFSGDGELHSLRVTDVKLGEAYLKTLKFLDQNWGKWEWTDGHPHLRLKGHDLVEDYNDLIGEVNRLRSSELESQSDLLKKIAEAKKHSTLK